MKTVNLRVSVPICGLRKGYAREYLETEHVPPPATVYGFLLSLVGEEDRYRYVGTRLALAVLCKPAVSTVLRTVWRVKAKGAGPGIGNNKKPDYQELLTGLEFAVWVAEGPLAERLDRLRYPETIERFGGLSLGESRDLVDEVTIDPKFGQAEGRWLCQDETGEHPLPVWVDHVGAKGTKRLQFAIQDGPLTAPGEDDPRWICIEPPPSNVAPAASDGDKATRTGKKKAAN
jgi:CRISPR-associated protein Cas5t